MSAIYGCIDLSGKAVSDAKEKQMRITLSDCKIDKFSYVQEKNVLLGCGLQFFTKEARRERVPFVEQQIYFTADVFLKNRKELIEKLELSDKAPDIADGDLLYQIYNHYGKEGLEQVVGSFAFVYYDSKSGCVDLVTDQLSDRTLYYYIEDGIVYFATLLSTLAYSSTNTKIKEQWIAEYLSMDDYGIFYDAQSTHYENICKVSNAQIVHITKDHISKETYWNPIKKVHKVKGKTDAWYKQKFKEVYRQSIKETLRSEKEYGIYLSGGLDSSSVACLTAPELAKEGKQLYAYTMTPEEGYIGEDNRFYVYDESSWVWETIKQFDNIIPHFYNFHNENCWRNMDEMIRIFEVPYKSLDNPMWLLIMAEDAYRDGVRIILNGQYGNNTVSYGGYEGVYTSLLKNGKIFQFVHELNSCRKNYNFSRKKIVKMLWKCKKDSMVNSSERKHLFEQVLTKQSLLRKYELEEKIWKQQKERANTYEVSGYQKAMLNAVYLRQIGEFETRQSLYTGVMVQDPTRDKRLIEFILSLPVMQFVKDGCQRRLIREYLRDEMPMEFVQDYKHRGIQAQDTFYRLNSDWSDLLKVFREYKENFNQHKVSKYLNQERMTAYIETLEKMTDIAKISQKEKMMLEKLIQMIIIDKTI